MVQLATLVKRIALSLMQEWVNETALGCDSVICIPSTAKPSYALQVLPDPNKKRKRTFDWPANMVKLCLAVSQLPLPLPPRQPPLFG